MLRKKLRWLTLFRVVLITALLVASLALELEPAEDSRGDETGSLVLYIATGTYFISVIYLALLRVLESTRSLKIFAYVQLIGDVGLAALLVRITGGTDSAFTIFFSLTIINAATLLYRPGAFALAFVSTIVFLGFTLAELGVVPGLAVLARGAVEEPTHQVLQRVALASRLYNLGMNAFAFFAVATLASYLAEQERRTERERIEMRSSLEDLKALHRNIVASVMSGLITVTNEGRITFFNRVAEQIVGASESDLLGKHIDTVFPNLHFTSEDVLRDAAYPSTRFTVDTLNGRTIHLRWSISPLWDSNERPIGHVLFMRDVTGLLDMERRMRRAEQLASIGELAARVAHEIRNPLASISASVELLQRYDPPDERARRLMAIVMREVDSLNSWIGDFLEYSREWSPDFQTVNLGGLVVETAEALRALGRDVQVAVEPSANAVLPGLLLSADAQRLKQVFWNLLRNAHDASDAKSTVWIALRAGKIVDTPAIVVEVRDSGAGISAENLQRIFEPFFTTKAKGTGLGLCTSQRVVELHGGVIDVESEVGKGSAFRVVLPTEREVGA